jgi:hypothetical protein
VLVGVSFSNLPDGVDSFLSARITVKNVLLLILLADGVAARLSPLRSFTGPSLSELQVRAGSSDCRHTVGSDWRFLSVDEHDRDRDGWQMPYFWLALLTHVLIDTNRHAGHPALRTSPLAPNPDCWKWSSGSRGLQRYTRLTGPYRYEWSALWTIRLEDLGETTIPNVDRHCSRSLSRF